MSINSNSTLLNKTYSLVNAIFDKMPNFPEQESNNIANQAIKQVYDSTGNIIAKSIHATPQVAQQAQPQPAQQQDVVQQEVQQNQDDIGEIMQNLFNEPEGLQIQANPQADGQIQPQAGQQQVVQQAQAGQQHPTPNQILQQITQQQFNAKDNVYTAYRVTQNIKAIEWFYNSLAHKSGVLPKVTEAQKDIIDNYISPALEITTASGVLIAFKNPAPLYFASNNIAQESYSSSLMALAAKQFMGEEHANNYLSYYKAADVSLLIGASWIGAGLPGAVIAIKGLALQGTIKCINDFAPDNSVVKYTMPIVGNVANIYTMLSDYNSGLQGIYKASVVGSDALNTLYGLSNTAEILSPGSSEWFLQRIPNAKEVFTASTATIILGLFCENFLNTLGDNPTAKGFIRDMTKMPATVLNSYDRTQMGGTKYTYDEGNGISAILKPTVKVSTILLLSGTGLMNREKAAIVGNFLGEVGNVPFRPISHLKQDMERNGVKNKTTGYVDYIDFALKNIDGKILVRGALETGAKVVASTAVSEVMFKNLGMASVVDKLWTFSESLTLCVLGYGGANIALGKKGTVSTKWHDIGNAGGDLAIKMTFMLSSVISKVLFIEALTTFLLAPPVRVAQDAVGELIKSIMPKGGAPNSKEKVIDQFINKSITSSDVTDHSMHHDNSGDTLLPSNDATEIKIDDHTHQAEINHSDL